MADRLFSFIRNRHFHSLLGNIASAFFNVLSFALLVRLLPAVAFGEWVLLLATYNIMDQVRTALLQSGLIRFYAGTEESTARQVCGAAWYVAIAFTGVLLLGNVLLLLTAYSYMNDVWKHFLYFLPLLLILSLPFNFASWLLQARHSFAQILHIRLIQNGSFLLLLGVLYLAGEVNLSYILYAYTLSLAITSVYCLLRRWTGIRSLLAYNLSTVKALFRYGRLIVGSMLTSGLIGYSDNFLIRTMIHPAAVAVYSIPQKFIEVIEILLRSFVATAQPTLSAAVNRNDWPAVARTFCRYTGAITLLILPCILLLMLLVKPLILLLAKSGYLDATPLVLIALSAAILYPIDRFTGVTLDMINKPQLNFYKNLLKVVINIGGDILFIWLFHDLRAVAAVSVINLVAGVLFGYYFLRKYLRFTVTDILRQGWNECGNMLQQLSQKLQPVKH